MKWNFPFFDNQVSGVEIVIDADGSLIYNYVVLEKSSSKIEIKKSGEGLSDLKQVFDSIDKKNPLCVSLNGKGIIHKRISATNDESFESLLNKALPNSHIEDFYVQKFTPEEEETTLSVARRSIIDATINSFLLEGYKVIACFLGSFAVQSALPLLQPENETSYELKFVNHEFLIRNGSISSYTSLSKNEPEKQIASDSIKLSSNLLIAFSSAFTYFYTLDSVTTNISQVAAAFKEFNDEMKFKKTGSLALAFFFTILLLNFMVFGYLSEKIKSKSSNALLSSSELSMIDSMDRQVNERTLFLSKSGLSEPSRTSFYADKIAKDLPEEITLSSIAIHPLRKNDIDEKNLEFENKEILVSGISKYSLDVNEWIQVMRKKDWINSISIRTYRQKGEGKQGEFLIEIKLN